MPQPTVETITTDILMLGSGGAGLFAALHAHRANPRAAILIVVKGLVGKSGCTRMVQGGYNAVLHPSDSLDQHFRDTIEGGAYLNDQELAWTLIKTAPERIRELESRMGCFFDRNPEWRRDCRCVARRHPPRHVPGGTRQGHAAGHWRGTDDVQDDGALGGENHRRPGHGIPDRRALGRHGNGGVYIDVSHLGATFVEQNFPGMVERCRDVGFDLAHEPVEVTPTAHYLMGGVRIDTACHSNLDGLFVAGEDSAGVHGANRLGGNGVACSTVFGGIAGERMATYIEGRSLPEVAGGQIRTMIARILAPFDCPSGEDVYVLHDELKALMWEKAGLVRNASDLERAQKALTVIRERTQHVRVMGAPRLNAEWQDWLNLDSLLTVCDLIVASALERKESRGAHYRSDYPNPDDGHYLQNIYLQRDGEGMRLWLEAVQLTHGCGRQQSPHHP